MTPLKRKNLRRMWSRGLLLFKQKNGAPHLFLLLLQRVVFKGLKTNNKNKKWVGKAEMITKANIELNLIELLATYLGA